MEFEPLAKTRTKIHRNPDGLLLVIPSKANWFAAVFLTAWLGGWFVGEISAIRALLNMGEGVGGSLFLVFWLIGWTVGGGFAAYSLLWMLVGQERVVVRSDSLSITRGLLTLGRTRSYDANQVRNLRAASPAGEISQLARSWQLSGQRAGGVIAFDYGARSVTFGSSIDEAEGRFLISVMNEWFPFSSNTSE